jgi:hypothetical protein
MHKRHRLGSLLDHPTGRTRALCLAALPEYGERNATQAIAPVLLSDLDGHLTAARESPELRRLREIALR